MEWVTQTTPKTWRKRPAKQFVYVLNEDGEKVSLNTGTDSINRTMDFPLQWQGSPVTTGKAVE